MNTSSEKQAPKVIGKISDSPLFWICMFASMGLLAMVAIQSKFNRRQSGIQHNAEMRRHVQKINNSPSDQIENQTFQYDQGIIHRLGPLFWFLSLLVFISWVILVRSRMSLYRQAIHQQTNDQQSSDAEIVSNQDRNRLT